MKTQFEIIITNAEMGKIEGFVQTPNQEEYCTLSEAGFGGDCTYDEIIGRGNVEGRKYELTFTGDFTHEEFIEFFDFDPSEEEGLNIDPNREGFFYQVEDNVATIVIGNLRHGSFAIETGEMV